MSTESKEAKDFEEKYKNNLLNETRELSSKLAELILGIQDVENFVNVRSQLPNLGITCNNKLIEIQKEFKKAGLSMYVEENEDYGIVSSSFLGDAIIQDLVNYVLKGIQNLEEYDYILSQASQKKIKQIQDLDKISPLKKFFARIKSWFLPGEQVNKLLTEPEIKKDSLFAYREVDEQLWNYNLRDNIVSSVVTQIRRQKYSAHVVPGLVKECVIPGLQKLGLGDLVPELEEKIIEEYKKDLPDAKTYQIRKEYMHLFVPDFNLENQEENGFVRMNIAKETKSLKENGITLNDLAFIDSTVNASERQLVTNAIREEIAEPVQENSQVKKKEEKEISE